METATATAAAGVRRTGVYLEASAEQTYFCTCYGTVELRDKAGRQRKLLVSTYHTPNIIYAQTVAGRLLAAAAVKDHTDAELIMLDALVGRTSPLVGRQQKQKAATAPVRRNRRSLQRPSPQRKSSRRSNRQPGASGNSRRRNPRHPVASLSSRLRSRLRPRLGCPSPRRHQSLRRPRPMRSCVCLRLGWTTKRSWRRVRSGSGVRNRPVPRRA